MASTIPPGKHALQLEVTDGDWLSVDHYSLTGYRAVNRPLRLNLYGLSCGRQALIWAQNAEHNWKNVFEKKSIPPVRATRIDVRGLPAGGYTAEWWDTWKGGVTRREPVTAAPGGLVLQLPEIAADVAARIGPAE